MYLADQVIPSNLVEISQKQTIFFFLDPCIKNFFGNNPKNVKIYVVKSHVYLRLAALEAHQVLLVPPGQNHRGWPG